MISTKNGTEQGSVELCNEGQVNEWKENSWPDILEKDIAISESISIKSSQIEKEHTVKPFNNHCPDCGFNDIAYESVTHEYVCRRCGLVIYSDLVDMGNEWRSYSVDMSNSRDRAGPPMIGKFTEETSTSFNTRSDGRGKTLPIQIRRDMGRLLKQNTKTILGTPHLRNLSIARNNLRLLVEKLKLTEGFYNDALIIYKKALVRELVLGKTIEGLAAASVYAVCREKKITRSLNDVAESMNLNPLTVARIYRELVIELHIRPPLDEPVKYVSVYASRLGLSWDVEQRAVAILQEAKTRGLLRGRNPRGLSGTSVYIAAKESQNNKDRGITQKRIS